MKFLILIMLASCAVKPVISKKSNSGGRVLMLGDHSSIDSDAIKGRNRKIASICNKGFTIEEEGLEQSQIVGGYSAMLKYYDFKCK